MNQGPRIPSVFRREAVLTALIPSAVFSFMVLKDGIVLPKALLFAGWLALLLIYAVFGLRKPSLLAGLLIIFLLFSKGLTGESEIPPSLVYVNFTVVVLTGLTLALTGGLRGRIEWNGRSGFLVKAVLALMLWMLFSMLRGLPYGLEVLKESLTHWIQAWATPVLVFFLVYGLMRRSGAGEDLVAVLAVAAAAAGFLGVYEYYDTQDRIGGLSFEPNMSGAFYDLIIFLPLSLILYGFRSGRTHWLWLPFALCFRAILATFSRGAYLGLAVGALVVTALKSRLAFLAGAGAVVLVLVVPSVLPEGVNKRIASTFRLKSLSSVSTAVSSDSLDRSSADRIHVWRGGMRMFEEHPLAGVGYNQFQTRVAPYWYGARYFDAHNLYTHILAELGVIGFLLFASVILGFFFLGTALAQGSGDTLIRAVATAFCGATASLAATNFFVTAFAWQEVSLVWWVMAAMLLAWHRRRARHE